MFYFPGPHVVKTFAIHVWFVLLFSKKPWLVFLYLDYSAWKVNDIKNLIADMQIVKKISKK